MKIDLGIERFKTNFPYLIIAVLPVPLLYMWFQTVEVYIPEILSEGKLIEIGCSIMVIWACVEIFSKSIKNYFIK